jgi:hypothetical protein
MEPTGFDFRTFELPPSFLPGYAGRFLVRERDDD